MNVTIEKQNDGSYIAYNPDESEFTLIGTGNTVAEAKEDFFNSIQETIENLNEFGDKIPESLTSTPKFSFDLSSLFEYYDFLNVSALARFLGFNETLMRQYKRGNTYISDKQLGKIEVGIHKIGAELNALKLV